MIYQNNSFHKIRDLEGVKIPSVKEVGKERKEVLGLVKKVIKDFRESYSHSKDSYANKTNQYKLNYLKELLDKNIEEQKEDVQKNISEYGITLSKEEKEQISKILKEEFNSISSKFVESVIKSFEEKLKELQTNETEKKEEKEDIPSYNLKIDEKTDNSDFLEEYFDNLYKKSEKYKDLKDELVNEMTDSHNDNMRLFKERIKQYKDNLISYEKKIKQANETIEKLKSENGKVTENKRQTKTEDTKSKKETNNLVKDNLLTQQIVDQVRKNQGLETAPKDKKLGPEHTHAANNLVDKFYKNGLIEFKLKSLKNTLKTFGVLFNFVLSPIGWISGKVFGAIKSVSESIFILGKRVFGAAKNIFLATLMSPTGSYTIGFIAGYVSSVIKDMWEKEEGWVGEVKKVWNFVYDYFINPLIKTVKVIYKILDDIVDMVANHPILFGSLCVMLKGIWWTIKNFSTIQKGFTIAKHGLKFAGPFILGLATSAATEAIFDNTVFKEDDTEKLTYNKDLQAKYAEQSNSINGETIANMNGQQNKKYSRLKNDMDMENKMISNIQGELEYISENYKDEIGQKKKFTSLGGSDLVRAVFNSRLYGFDKEEYENYIIKEKDMSLKDQISTLADYLNVRALLLSNQMNALSISSKNGILDMYNTLDEMVDTDKNGNYKGLNKDVIERMKLDLGLKHGAKGSNRSLYPELDINNQYLKKYDERNTQYYQSGKYKDIDGRNFINGPLAGFHIELEKIEVVDKLTSDKSDNINFLMKSIIRAKKLRIDHLATTFSLKHGSTLVNNAFMKMIDMKTIADIARVSGGDEMDRMITQYFERVLKEYKERNVNEITRLKNDIKRLDENINEKTEQLDKIRKQIKEYNQKGYH